MNLHHKTLTPNHQSTHSKSRTPLTQQIDETTYGTTILYNLSKSFLWSIKHPSIPPINPTSLLCNNSFLPPLSLPSSFQSYSPPTTITPINNPTPTINTKTLPHLLSTTYQSLAITHPIPRKQASSPPPSSSPAPLEISLYDLLDEIC